MQKHLLQSVMETRCLPGCCSTLSCLLETPKRSQAERQVRCAACQPEQGHDMAIKNATESEYQIAGLCLLASVMTGFKSNLEPLLQPWLCKFVCKRPQVGLDCSLTFNRTCTTAHSGT